MLLFEIRYEVCELKLLSGTPIQPFLQHCQRLCVGSLLRRGDSLRLERMHAFEMLVN